MYDGIHKARKGHYCPLDGLPASEKEPDVDSEPHTSQSQASVVFGNGQPVGRPLIPGYNAPAFALKPARDPELSLIALSGTEPREPMMVDVPQVLNNVPATVCSKIAGWRVGYADRYIRDSYLESLNYSAAFVRSLDVLRQAGAQLVLVDSQHTSGRLQSIAPGRNEVDDLVAAYRLDALVSDGRITAFHQAYQRGNPALCEPLEDGTHFWFYGARWSRDSLAVLARAYQQTASG